MRQYVPLHYPRVPLCTLLSFNIIALFFTLWYNAWYKSTYQANLSASGNYLYNGKEIKFTTCRKFKGLEADMVILVDVDYSVLRDNNMLFYVGASRARLELIILCNLDDDKCSVVISDWGGFVKKNNPKQTLSKMLGCKLE